MSHPVRRIRFVLWGLVLHQKHTNAYKLTGVTSYIYTRILLLATSVQSYNDRRFDNMLMFPVVVQENVVTIATINISSWALHRGCQKGQSVKGGGTVVPLRLCYCRTAAAIVVGSVAARSISKFRVCVGLSRPVPCPADDTFVPAVCPRTTGNVTRMHTRKHRRWPSQ